MKHRIVVAIFVIYNLFLLYFVVLFLSRIYNLYRGGYDTTVKLLVITTLVVIFIGGAILLAKSKLVR